MVTSITQSKCIKLWLSGISQSICITVFQDEINLASKDLSLVIAKYSNIKTRSYPGSLHRGQHLK